jgi:hypothetical protein
LYIASYLRTTQDENLNQTKEYDKPIKYYFNVQPVNQDSEIREFGEMSSSMKVATITERLKYLDKFKEFDVAYLDGTTPDNERNNGDNANYRIYSVRNQNTIIKVYFIKVVKD